MNQQPPAHWTPPNTRPYSDPIVKTPSVGVLEKHAAAVDMARKEAWADRAPDVKRAAGDRKCPMHLLPPEFLRLTSLALKSGADKYGAFNWRLSGLRLDTYVGAIMRHTTAMAEGEWMDPDSGLPHIAMIAANAAVLIDCDHVGKLGGKEGPVAEQKEGAVP